MGKRTSIAVEFRSDTTDIKRGADEVRKEMQKLKAHSEAMKVRMVEPPSVSAAQASARAMMAAWGSNVQTVQRDNLAQAVSAQAMFQRQAAHQARTLGGGTVIGQSGHWNFAGAGASGGGGGGGNGGGNGNGVARGATNAGMGMLMLAQGLDDLQYGFKSVVNNIAPLVMALGGGPGLAGVAAIAGVGLNILIPKVQELFTSAEEIAARINQRRSIRKKFQQEADIQDAGRQGAAEAESIRAQTKANDDAVSKQMRELARAQRMEELQGKLRAAKAEGTPSQKETKSEAEEYRSSIKNLRQVIEQASIDSKNALAEENRAALALAETKAELDKIAKNDLNRARQREMGALKERDASELSDIKRKEQLTPRVGALEEKLANSRARKERSIADQENAAAKLKEESVELEIALVKARTKQLQEEKAVQDELKKRLNAWNQSINDTAVEFHEFGIAMRQLAQSIKDTQQNIVKDETRKAEIARLRRVGRNAKADKMEDEDAVKDLQQQGLTKEQAENVVAMRRQTQEGGNRRIRQKRTQQKEENVNPWKNPEPGLKRNNGGKEGGFFDGLADAGTEKVVSLLTEIKEKLRPTPSESITHPVKK